MMEDALNGKPIERQVNTPFVIATQDEHRHARSAEVHLQDEVPA